MVGSPNLLRFSLVSCMTEDSVDSNGLSTPLDASPQPPPSNTFSIINIVNDDPLPNTRSLPYIASHRRRAQTSLVSSAPPVILEQQSLVAHTNISNNNSIEQLSSSNSNNNSQQSIQSTDSTNSSKLSRFWPKLKQSKLFTTNSSAAQTADNNKNQIFIDKKQQIQQMVW